MRHTSALAIILLSLFCTFAYTLGRDLLQDTNEGTANAPQAGAAPGSAPVAAQAPDSAPAASSLPAPLPAPEAVRGADVSAQAPTQVPAVSTATSGICQGHTRLAAVSNCRVQVRDVQLTSLKPQLQPRKHKHTVLVVKVLVNLTRSAKSRAGPVM